MLDGRKREDILRHFLGPLSEEQVAEYGRTKEQLFREEARHVSIVAGVEKFIAEIEQAKIPMAIASSGSSSRVRFFLERPPLKDRFAAVVTGDDVLKGKPDPEIFHRAAEAVGAPFTETLVVEDAVAGVVAAKSIGMWCLAIASNGRGRELRAAGADEVAPDFRGLTLASLAGKFSEISRGQKRAG